MKFVEVLKELNLPEDIFYMNQSESRDLFEEELSQNSLKTFLLAKPKTLLLLLNYQKPKQGIFQLQLRY